jgi:hypothetical protein
MITDVCSHSPFCLLVAVTGARHCSVAMPASTYWKCSYCPLYHECETKNLKLFSEVSEDRCNRRFVLASGFPLLSRRVPASHTRADVIFTVRFIVSGPFRLHFVSGAGSRQLDSVGGGAPPSCVHVCTSLVVLSGRQLRGRMLAGRRCCTTCRRRRTTRRAARRGSTCRCWRRRRSCTRTPTSIRRRIPCVVARVHSGSPLNVASGSAGHLN